MTECALAELSKLCLLWSKDSKENIIRLVQKYAQLIFFSLNIICSSKLTVFL